MNKTIYILAAIMAAMLTGIASAADGRPDSFVSKDKVWHYNFLHYMLWDIDSETKGPSARFCGDCISKNGKDYSVLMQTNKYGEARDTIALFRQDGGKLFVLNDERLNRVVQTKEGVGNPEYLGKEFLVFDFDAKPGDTYLGLACGDMGYELVEVCVKSTFAEEIRGRQYVRQILCRADDPYWEAVAIEGIGVCGPDWFFLPYLGTRFSGRRDSYADLELRKVTDEDGGVLFTAADFTGEPDHGYQSFIREDRVWEYFTTDHDYMSYGNCRLYRWQFVGTEKEDGKTYHRLMQTGQTTWIDHHDPDGTVSDVKELKEEKLIALMREENGKVYVLDKEWPAPDNVSAYDGHDSYGCKRQRAGTPAGKERLLYDFSLHPGDTLSISRQPLEGNTKFVYEVDSVSFTYYSSPKTAFSSKILHFTSFSSTHTPGPDFSYSDAAGNLFLGDMLDINLGPYPSCDCGHTTLNNMYDLEGNILFRGENNKYPQAGMTDIADGPSSLAYSGGVIMAKGEGALVLELFSSDGIKTAHAEGSGEISVSASGLVPGVYLVTLSSDGKSVSTLRIRI